jgi:hypothetical protein
VSFMLLRASHLLSIIVGRSNDMKLKDMSKFLLAIIFTMTALVILSIHTPVFAEEANSGEPKIGVSGFLDEDGDGFNDLLPDGDGDGVPDALDPDYRNRQSDSIFVRQQLRSADDSTSVHHHDLPGDDFRHPIIHDGMGPMGPGEPGQYGPGDSTGHGGMHGGHDRDGHHRGGDMGGDPDTSGMGGGGHRPIIDPHGGDNHEEIRKEVARDNTNIDSHKGMEKRSQPDQIRDDGK